MKTLTIILAFLFLVSTAHAQKATVTKISDGDTIWIKTSSGPEKLRLIGIDTPETFSSSKLDRDLNRCQISRKDMITLGKQASSHLRSLLSIGDPVEIKSYGKGKYQRTLAEVYKNSENLNLKMVSDGYACVYLKSSELPLISKFEYAVSGLKAILSQSGLWKGNMKTMFCLCLGGLL